MNRLAAFSLLTLFAAACMTEEPTAPAPLERTSASSSALTEPPSTLSCEDDYYWCYNSCLEFFGRQREKCIDRCAAAYDDCAGGQGARAASPAWVHMGTESCADWYLGPCTYTRPPNQCDESIVIGAPCPTVGATCNQVYANGSAFRRLRCI